MVKQDYVYLLEIQTWSRQNCPLPLYENCVLPTVRPMFN